MGHRRIYLKGRAAIRHFEKLREPSFNLRLKLYNKAEDKHRRRFFSHYCAASVCASLSVTAQVTIFFMIGLKIFDAGKKYFSCGRCSGATRRRARVRRARRCGAGGRGTAWRPRRGTQTRGTGSTTSWCSGETVQYSTVQYSAVQCSTVQYNTVNDLVLRWDRTVQYSAVQYSTVHGGETRGS